MDHRNPTCERINLLYTVYSKKVVYALQKGWSQVSLSIARNETHNILEHQGLKFLIKLVAFPVWR